MSQLSGTAISFSARVMDCRLRTRTSVKQPAQGFGGVTFDGRLIRQLSFLLSERAMKFTEIHNEGMRRNSNRKGAVPFRQNKAE